MHKSHVNGTSSTSNKVETESPDGGEDDEDDDEGNKEEESSNGSGDYCGIGPSSRPL